ncbi:MAG: family 78 glycoside hydrolase catalytic domain [Bacteroidota bacterium]|nr:family 78 glycoside hydrolase catalytic domain [Bacteroidota bacterium]
MKKLILFLLALICTISVYGIEVNNLRTDTRINPLGLDNIHPSLSWMINGTGRNIMQTAYQIMVATSPEKLAMGDADLWNSGKVESDQSIYISYNGTALKSGQQCFWKVKVWSNKGETKWSSVSKWSMGLLEKSDWKGEWIGLAKLFSGDTIAAHSRLSARYLRKEFISPQKIKRATIYIIGLGMYELYINGEKVGNQELAPSPTDFSKDVRYNTFDVTESLKKGKNAIAVVLGNGRYFYMRQGFNQSKEKLPKMLFQLEVEYADGNRTSIISDRSWKITTDGPIRSNNEYDGEEYDARKELKGWQVAGYNDSQWLSAEQVTAPCNNISSQLNENMIVQEVIKPKSITRLQNGKYILDMGQNMAGWLKLKANGKAGDTISLRFAETLKADGSLFTDNLRRAQQTDKYIMKGGNWEEWQPTFVYHGFRYVEIMGYSGVPAIDNFEGKVIYDGFKTIGSFECSDSLLNVIYRNACRTIRNNFKGMPIDCPQRDERDPWLGDWATTSIGASYTFDHQRLFAKWLDDIQFAQRASGQLPDIAPEPGWTAFKDNMTWPGTYLLIGNMLLTRFGNKDVIVKHYPSMKKWLWYMKGKYLKDNILIKDRFGDWCVPPESPELIHSQDSTRQTSGELISTAYFYHFLQMMYSFAAISGNNSDISECQTLASQVRTAFNRKFFNANTHQYANNTVTANLLPLAFDLVDKGEEDLVFNRMIDRIINQDKCHISTGLIGCQWLMRELTKRGRVDIAWQIATQTDYPGWGYMVKNGATTVWELWNGNTADPTMNSQNHVMLLGDLIAWMYGDLAGLKPAEGCPGFQKLRMEPHIPGNLTSVTAYTETPYGQAKSDWVINNGQFIWNVVVPVNTRANLLLPAASLDDIRLNGRPVQEMEGVKFMGTERERISVEVGSGIYKFICKYHQFQH